MGGSVRKAEYGNTKKSFQFVKLLWLLTQLSHGRNIQNSILLLR